MGEERGKRQRSFLTTSRLLWMVVVAVVLAFIVLFVADNFVLIEIRLVNARVEVRLAWALLIALLLGVILGFLLARFRR